MMRSKKVSKRNGNGQFKVEVTVNGGQVNTSVSLGTDGGRASHKKSTVKKTYSRAKKSS
jgi:hypothetical protein